MSHAWEVAWATEPKRVAPHMDTDPQPPMCHRCQHLHDADTARLRQLLHNLADLDARQRADIDRLTADIATLTAANAALRRHHDKGTP